VAQGDLESAVADLDVALQLNPNPDLFVKRARIQQEAGDVEGAIAGYREGLVRLGWPVSLGRSLLELLVETEKWNEALALIDTLAQRAGRRATWQLERADVLRAAGRNDEARALCEDALAQIEQRAASGRMNALVELERIRALAGLDRTDEARERMRALPEVVHGLTDYQELEQRLGMED
jgi:tetratricopeptide (TPR) repeat protein